MINGALPQPEKKIQFSLQISFLGVNNNRSYIYYGVRFNKSVRNPTKIKKNKQEIK